MRLLDCLLFALLIGLLVACLSFTVSLFLTMGSQNDISEIVWLISIAIGIVSFLLAFWWKWRDGRDMEGGSPP